MYDLSKAKHTHDATSELAVSMRSLLSLQLTEIATDLCNQYVLGFVPIDVLPNLPNLQSEILQPEELYVTGFWCTYGSASNSRYGMYIGWAELDIDTQISLFDYLIDNYFRIVAEAR